MLDRNNHRSMASEQLQLRKISSSPVRKSPAGEEANDCPPESIFQWEHKNRAWVRFCPRRDSDVELKTRGGKGEEVIECLLS